MAWAPDYVTLNEAKEFLRIPLDDTEDDTVISLSITAASREIDRFAGRQFGAVDVAEERFYTPERVAVNEYEAGIDDVQNIAGLLVTGDGVTVDAVDYDLGPINAASIGAPFTCIRFSCSHDRVGVTALFGWSAVPDAVKSATLLQVSRLFSRRNAPFGVAGSPDVGSEVRLLAKLDADVQSIVGAYKRWWSFR